MTNRPEESRSRAEAKSLISVFAGSQTIQPQVSVIWLVSLFKYKSEGFFSTSFIVHQVKIITGLIKYNTVILNLSTNNKQHKIKMKATYRERVRSYLKQLGKCLFLVIWSVNYTLACTPLGLWDRWCEENPFVSNIFKIISHTWAVQKDRLMIILWKQVRSLTWPPVSVNGFTIIIVTNSEKMSNL